MYDAESADELALVKAADAYGFTLSARTATELRVRLPTGGSSSTRDPDPPTSPSTTTAATTPSPVQEESIHENELELEVLKVLPFDSDRKRMSIVVRHGQRLLLFCKGADEQVLPNLAADVPAELVALTRQQLVDYGKTGLRTLCLAMRELDPEAFEEWLESREYVSRVVVWGMTT